MNHEHHSTESSIGVGATSEFCLRVSVACLARVIFTHPTRGNQMLVLERTATLLDDEDGRRIMLWVRPFGGACRLRQPNALRDLIGDFHFDSLKSQAEQDFRILIRPSDWDAVKQFCLQHLNTIDDAFLEANPDRELIEEFADALKINLSTEQYSLRAIDTVVENNPGPTHNIHATGVPTVRIYRVFETRIIDPALSMAILANSEQHPAARLEQLAREDAHNGGRGRANAALAVSMQSVRELYLHIPPETRHLPMSAGDERFHGNVPALFEDILVPEYQRT